MVLVAVLFWKVNAQVRLNEQKRTSATRNSYDLHTNTYKVAVDNVCKLWGIVRVRLTEVFSAGVHVVPVRRGRFGVRRRGVQGGALVPPYRRQSRHKRRIVLERRTHHPAVNTHTLVTQSRC